MKSKAIKIIKKENKNSPKAQNAEEAVQLDQLEKDGRATVRMNLRSVNSFPKKKKERRYR